MISRLVIYTDWNAQQADATIQLLKTLLTEIADIHGEQIRRHRAAIVEPHSEIDAQLSLELEPHREEPTPL